MTTPTGDLVRAGLERLLDGARRPVLVVAGVPDVVTTGLGDGVDVVAPGDPRPDREHRSVVVVAPDPLRLCTALEHLVAAGGLGRARRVGVVSGQAVTAIVPRPHPAFAPFEDLEARLDDGVATTRVDLVRRGETAPVLAALARSTAGGVPSHRGHGGLRVAPAGVGFDDPETQHPPDVVVATPAPPAVSTVTGRAPWVTPEAPAAVVDEAFHRPVGFTTTWRRGVVDLDPTLAPDDIGPALVATLRDAQAVRVPADAAPVVLARLAASGVPVLGPDEPAGGLDDPDAREDHSVGARRAALAEHGRAAVRARLAAQAGVRPAAPEVGDDLVLHLDPGVPHGPDLVDDLLLARTYTGADVVVSAPADGGPTEAWIAPAEAVAAPAVLTPRAGIPDGARCYRIHARNHAVPDPR